MGTYSQWWSQVRLRTALRTPSFVDGVSEYSQVVGGSGNTFDFMCKCGNGFSLSKEYDIYEPEQLRCSACKRSVQPLVGERAVYKRVKSDANRAGREFDLPMDWFKHAIHAPCHYCGRSDRNSISVPSKRPGEWLVRDFKYNGLDRLNNDIGYVIQNCVPCCYICNRAKNSMVYQDFIEYINDMVQYRSNL